MRKLCSPQLYEAGNQRFVQNFSNDKSCEISHLLNLVMCSSPGRGLW